MSSPVVREPVNPERVFGWLLLATLAFKLLLAWRLPVTGDEAFFYWWGVYPDFGYYDHPPMVGWFIWLSRVFGESPFAIRLPATLLSTVIALGIHRMVRPIAPEKAAWAAMLYLLAPISWLNVLITTDTPLMLWSFLSVWALVAAERSNRASLYALSGLLLGAAFLSKYFSALLGVAYLVYFVVFRRDRLGRFALLVLCALPGPAINLWFNWSHGWPNIMFNVYNRNEQEVAELRKPLLYLALLVYLITPPLLWSAWRNRKALCGTLAAHRLLACAVVVPLLLFGLLSIKKVIGLHWVLSFYPFGFVLLALAVPRERLPRVAVGLAVFSLLHLIAVSVASMSTMETWRTNPSLSKFYSSIVLATHGDELYRQLTRPGVVVMAHAYTPASLIGFEAKAYVPVFGVGSFHARQDDLVVDYRRYDGQTVRVVRADQPNPLDYAPYFDSIRLYTVTVAGQRFNVVEGHGFHFDRYREGVLMEIARRYYRIPSWLPMSGCPFCERVCGGVRCELPAQ